MKNLCFKLLCFLVLVMIAENVKAQTIFDAGEVVVGPINGISNLSIADINEDGNDDLLFMSTNDYKARWYSNSGNFEFEEESVSYINDMVDATTTLSSTGHQDIVFASQDALKLFRNDGTGTWIDSTNLSYVYHANDITSANVYTSDDQAELLTVSGDRRKILLYSNLNSPNPTLETLLSEPLFTRFVSLETIDITNNGRLDIVLLNNDQISYLKNVTDGQFIGDINILSNIQTPTAVTFGDFDGDGDVDVAAAIENENRFVFIPNDGDGTFGDAIVLDVNTQGAYDIHASDMDNDGDLDVLVITNGGNKELALYENDGTGDFSPKQIIDQSVDFMKEIGTSDIDNDGDLDIVLLTTGVNGEILVYKNLLEEELMEVSGNVFVDYNQNDTLDGIDETFAGLAVTVQPDGRIFYTNSDGFFRAYTATEGTNSITVQTPSFISCNGFVSYTPSIPENGTYEFEYVPLLADSQDFAFTTEDDICVPVSGKVYKDLNNNGIIDDDESGVSGIRVKAFNDDIFRIAYTNVFGEYNLVLPAGDSYEVEMELPDPSSNQFFCNLIIASYTQTFPESNGNYSVDVNAGETYDSLDFAVSTSSAAAFDVRLVSLRVDNGNHTGKRFSAWMDFKSRGQITEDCVLRINHDPRLAMEYAQIPVTNTGSDYVEWVFPPGTAPNSYCMSMRWVVDGELNIGDTLHWEANYNCPPEIDACPGNNQIIRDIAITDSSGRIVQEDVRLLSLNAQGNMPEVVENDDIFSYVVAFVNPLPTVAHSVTIIDTLPEMFDLATISNTFSSYQNTIFDIRDNGILVWEMDGINLADVEEDEVNSYGFVQFNVKLKPDLPDGTIIPNKATVYFNGNEGIISNEVIHRIDESVGIINHFENKINAEIYPNPFSYQTIFKLKEPWPHPYTLKLVNVLGKEVRSYHNLTETEIKIQKDQLPRGIYFLNVFEEGKEDLLGSYQLIIQ